MWRGGFTILALAAGAAAAQTVADPAKLPAEAREFRGSTRTLLPCKVQPIKPTLNFRFRFQTGYLVQVPMNLYPGGKHHWEVIFRLTPQSGNGRPVYFTDSLDLPAGRPETIAEMRGMFLVGEGRYGVNWSLVDDSGRMCRKDWDVEARAGRDEHVLMPPGTAGDWSWRPAGAAGAGGYPRRVTVVVNAALPRAARSGEPNPTGDPSLIGGRWATLTNIVASVVERLAGAWVRMVVINLDQQRELFRQDGFTMDGMDRLAHAADGRQQWSVDYHVLQNPAGGWNLLAGVVKGEMQAAEAADVVVIVGLPWRTAEKMPADFPEAGMEAPRFVYLQYRAAWAVGWASGAGGIGPGNPNRRGRLAQPGTAQAAGRHRPKHPAHEGQDVSDLHAGGSE